MPMTAAAGRSDTAPRCLRVNNEDFADRVALKKREIRKCAHGMSKKRILGMQFDIALAYVGNAIFVSDINRLTRG